MELIALDKGSVAYDRESLAHMERRFVLPLEGKGDRSAVDEVKMRTVSLARSANSTQSKSARQLKLGFNYRAPLLTIDY